MTDTERIDLDELDTGDDEDESAEPHRGDWLWRETDTPPTEPADPDADTESETDPESTESTASATESGAPATESTESSDDATTSDGPVPHVPRQNQDKPVGIPVEGGGAGAGPAEGDSGDQPTGQEGGAAQPSEGDDAPGNQPEEPRPMSTADYHDADVDDMTMAITYNAVRQLADPSLALAQARDWSDWIGIVGDVPAHTINKFQREHQIDADFFNGTGTNPGERLAEIDRNSMFFAERLVVVGVADEDESIASVADWEFVPLSEAAEKAGWELASS